MDKLDFRILQELQNDFPLSERPYEIIASRLDISCDELCKRVEKMVTEGVIRRIGASLDSRKLGFCSTLAAVSVGPGLVERAAEIIGRFPEVTHSYLRSDDFNIWFTIIAADQEKLTEILDEIRTALSLDSSDILNLPVKRLFKLDARFKVDD
jgi:DNA-binding Lrp family transcriptional regulator